MARWYMDPQVYGRPFVGHTVELAQTFDRDISTVGAGQYRLRDPFATRRVQLQWLWRRRILSVFRFEWEDVTELAFGSRWFEIDLVLGTGTDGFQNTPDTEKRYLAHFTEPYSATLIGYNKWSVTASVEIAGEVS